MPIGTNFPVVAPVISRPGLDISPPPSPRPRLALAQGGWRGWPAPLPRLKNPRLWGLGLGSVALGLVNGALVVSAGVGLVVYQQLLQLSPRQRQGLMQRLRQGLPLPATAQQQALLLGLVAGAGTYTFSSLEHSTHSPLLALLLTGQGALALFAVGALVRSSRSAEDRDPRWEAAPVAQVEHNLAVLSHPDPLKRLVAVRRLVRLAQADHEYLAGALSVRSHLIDCLRLRLGQETDAIVRSAIESGLELLQPTRSLAPSLAVPVTAEPLAPVPHELVLEPEAAAPAPAPPVSELNASTEVAAPAPQGRRPVEYVEYLDI